ncbi:uncharacterized protein SPSC_02149 [Sporisorium scitamineum]|uniref:Uncharacterized protein n=1 Tax=Sporisorium scitamineum TaxID=49012 RepID=A0A127ZBK5_9BASI|nr:uncharacterized protein SPSC_02149 [Sporisorium scitamineum]
MRRMAPKLGRLVLPERSQTRSTAPTPSFRDQISAQMPRSHIALADCWAHTTITTFDPVDPHQQRRWPFSTTTVIERDPDSFPTDLGLLDPEDLGDEVVTSLGAAGDGRQSPAGDDVIQRNDESPAEAPTTSSASRTTSAPPVPRTTSTSPLRPAGPASASSSVSGSTDFIVGSPTSSFDTASYSPSSTSCPSSLRMADTGSSLCSSPSSRYLSTSLGVASPTSSFDAALSSSMLSVRFVDIPSSPPPFAAGSSPSGQDVVLDPSWGRLASSSPTGSVYFPRPRSESSTSEISVDSAHPSSPSPTPSVPNVIVISDDETDTDRSRVDAAGGSAPDTAHPAAPAPRPASSVKKPKITNIRSRRYRIVVPSALREVLRYWRASAQIVKNEAIRFVNMADGHAHEYLKPFTMTTLLVNNSSDFVCEQPFLAKCPTYIRRQVVNEAISARKSILTQHYDTPRSQRGPIPTISPSTAHKDKRQGFSVALDPQSGSIDFEVAEARAPRRAGNDTAPAATPGRHERRITSLTLKIAPRHVRHRKASPDVKICLRGQHQRQWLVDVMNRRPMGRGDKFQMPREWHIQCDRYGRWYLVVLYQVASDAAFHASKQARQVRGGETTLEGPVRVKSCDPGVRTPYSIYTSEGQTIDIGDDANKDRLEQLRLQMDEVHSQWHKCRPMNRRPSRNISRKKRAKRKRRLLNSKEHRDLLGKQLRVSEKIRNLVTDIQCRTANFLAVLSDIIVMLRMEVGRMISRKGGLAASTKRELKGWSYTKFLDRLATKCHDMQFDTGYERPWETVLLV